MKVDKGMPLFNQVLKPVTQDTVTMMSSREIAELTEKQHQHVKRDIEKLCAELQEDVSKFGRIYFDSMNRSQTEYLLDRDTTENLLLGYSAPLRKKVLARLRELEEMVANPKVDPSDPAWLRSVLIGYTEKVLELEAQVEEQKPKVEALDRLAGLSGSVCITDAAKMLKVSPKVLFKWLDTHGWTYRRGGRYERVAYQSKIEAGYLEHRPHEVMRTNGEEIVRTQAIVTPKGLAYLAQIFPPAVK